MASEKTVSRDIGPRCGHSGIMAMQAAGTQFSGWCLACKRYVSGLTVPVLGADDNSVLDRLVEQAAARKLLEDACTPAAPVDGVRRRTNDNLRSVFG